jgi:accessory colonization factor AcfC
MNRSDYLFAEPSIFEGLSRIFDFGNTLNVYNDSLTSEEADALAIWMDWCASGEDIMRAIEDYRSQISVEAAA